MDEVRTFPADAEPSRDRVRPRVLRAGGLLLALILFVFLPAVTASCDLPGDSSMRPGHLDISVSAPDMALGRGSVQVTGLDSGAVDAARMDAGRRQATDHLSRSIDPAGRAIAAASLAVLPVAALGALLIRRWGSRASIGALVLAALLVGAAGWRAVHAVISWSRSYVALVRDLPEARGQDLGARFSEAVHLGAGWWSCLAVLVVMIAVEGVAVVRSGGPAVAPPGPHGRS